MGRKEKGGEMGKEGWGGYDREGEDWGAIRFDWRKIKESNSSDQDPLHHCIVTGILSKEVRKERL